MKKDRGLGANTSNQSEATVPAHASAALMGERTDGEFPGAGSRYSATLNERANKSNTRNRGPMHDPGEVGGAQLPVARMTGRAVSRVGSVTVKRGS